MTAVRRGLDVVVDLLGVLAWGFAAYVIGSRFISPSAGSVFGIALALTALGWAINTHMQDSRMRNLAVGSCPRCKASIKSEHEHRRWDSTRSAWLQPATSWQCGSCGFGHSEVWACPSCPDAQ